MTWRNAKLTRHFNVGEFFDPNDLPGLDEEEMEVLAIEYHREVKNLALMLEGIRVFTGPIKITSGYRSKKGNRKAGGKPSSLHMQGLAVDFRPMNLFPHQYDSIARELAHRWDGGFHKYRTWIHLDFGSRRRW